MHLSSTLTQEGNDSHDIGAKAYWLQNPSALHLDRTCPLPEAHLTHLEPQPRAGGGHAQPGEAVNTSTIFQDDSSVMFQVQTTRVGCVSVAILLQLLIKKVVSILVAN